jgi:biopolymer transport protein ExbB
MLVLALLSIAQPAAAGTWWNEAWQFRKEIALAVPEGVDPASRLVVPVRLHTGNFNFFQDLGPAGADIRFIASDDASPLAFRIETLDVAAGLLVAWVDVPPLVGKPGVDAVTRNRSIWMYYGNSAATPPVAARLYGPDASLVLPFNETQNPGRDGSGYGLAVSSQTLTGDAGLIGNGALAAGGQFLQFGTHPALALAAGSRLSFGAWVRSDAADAKRVLYRQQQGDQIVEVGLADGRLYESLRRDGVVTRIESSTALGTGAWHHVDAIFGAESGTLYLDGVVVGKGSHAGLPQLAGDVTIGGAAGATGSTVQIDQVELWKAERSAATVGFTVSSQAADSLVLTVGEDQSRGTADKFGEYLKMMGGLFAQVSLDGLVVIVFTALMGLASLAVFVRKTRELARIERDDARFLASFERRFQEDLSVAGGTQRAASVPAGDGDRDGASLLARLHTAAFGELREAQSAGGAPSSQGLAIAAEGFEAIRAAIDAAVVDANNQLNASLVVMTVSISGAPFLGLLGTVVGVMITFASIAAAGDVNVNTIAPGVAAAMMATVAGLLVAIPSLFGYNWLATRIGRHTSFLEVFGNRIVSKLGLAALQWRSARLVPEEQPRAA